MEDNQSGPKEPAGGQAPAADEPKPDYFTIQAGLSEDPRVEQDLENDAPLTPEQVAKANEHAEAMDSGK